MSVEDNKKNLRQGKAYKTGTVITGFFVAVVLFFACVGLIYMITLVTDHIQILVK